MDEVRSLEAATRPGPDGLRARVRGGSLGLAWRRTLALAALLGALACLRCGGDAPFFPPSVVLALQLPADLPPSRATCLDVVLASPTQVPPPVSIGFGGDPLLVRLQTLDLDNDARDETRIRFVQGARPFGCDPRTEVLLTRAGADTAATFVVTAVIRNADGPNASDACLGGTVLAQGRAELDRAGQPIRFPSRGDAFAPLTLTCALPSGCALPDDPAARCGVTP